MATEPGLSIVGAVLVTAKEMPELRPRIQDVTFRAWLLMMRNLDNVCRPTPEVPDWRDRIGMHDDEYMRVACRKSVRYMPTSGILDSLKQRVSALEIQCPRIYAPSLEIFHQAIAIGDDALFSRTSLKSNPTLATLNMADELFFVQFGLDLI